MFRVRDNTQDAMVFVENIVENEYRLPDRFSGSDVIVDVGANIGTFAAACLVRGVGYVACFEPEERNFRVLVENMREYGSRVKVVQLPVWRSDRYERVDLRNTGNFTAMHRTVPGAELETIGLDDILRSFSRVRLLKLDCEGAEYPILYTCTELRRVDEVVCELHPTIPEGMGDWDRSNDALFDLFLAQGFGAEIVPNPRAPDEIQTLFARRLL